jgi:high-affinity Fe2+/Pb2+ permease
LVKETAFLDMSGSTLMAIAMLAAFALAIAGSRLLLRPGERGRGALMMVAAAVLFGNVLIWTV